MSPTKADIHSLVREQWQMNEIEERLFGTIKTPPLRYVTKDWLIEAVRVLGVSISHETDEWGDQVNYIDYEGFRFIAHKARRRRG